MGYGEVGVLANTSGAFEDKRLNPCFQEVLNTYFQEVPAGAGELIWLFQGVEIPVWIFPIWDGPFTRGCWARVLLPRAMECAGHISGKTKRALGIFVKLPEAQGDPTWMWKKTPWLGSLEWCWNNGGKILAGEIPPRSGWSHQKKWEHRQNFPSV